ncbi:hypothetical protein LCGC14_1857560, partial [marine sediment metagenome]
MVEIINNTDFLEALNALFEYSKKIFKFFHLKEGEDLINEIYKNNNLEYFKQIEEKMKKSGPIQALRYNILMQFIRDKDQNLNSTLVSEEFIIKTIDELSVVGFNGNIFKKKSFDKTWTNYHFTRILLYFYDYKFKIENKKKFLILVKFLLYKLNLDDYEEISNLRIDDEGKIVLKDKPPKAKTIIMKRSAFSIIDFEARVNYKFFYDPWIAIFPSQFKKHQRAYQIFMRINPKTPDLELSYGLHPGSKTITHLCKENKNLKGITLDFNNKKLLETIINFYSKEIIPEYNRLNNLENRYSKYKNINCWFVSPQPPDETVRPVKEKSPENSMFEIMMNRGIFALGWPEIQKNLDNLNLDNMKIEGLSDDVIKMYKAIKNEIEIGDIVIAIKGGPDKKNYSVGYVTS